MVTINYELYREDGTVLGVVSFTGKDEQECDRQLKMYLDRVNGLSREDEVIHPWQEDFYEG